MKNNRVTFPQFCFTSMLACFVSLLFIEGRASLLCFLAAALALAFDVAVILLYKGSAGKIIKTVIMLYLFLYCSVVAERFCEFLYSDLGYRPYWILTLLVLGFAFLCSVKGIEALCRAAVIITGFVFIALIYIASSSFYRISLDVEFVRYNGFILPFVLVCPAAVYILCYDNIIPEKKYTTAITFPIVLITVIYYYLLPNDKVAVGIFKGADGVLTAVLSVAALYALSSAVIGLFKGFKHKRILSSVYLSAIFGAAVAMLYSETFLMVVESDLILILTVLCLAGSLIAALFAKNEY